MTIEKQLATALERLIKAGAYLETERSSNWMGARDDYNSAVAQARSALAAYDARPVAGDDVERVARAIHDAGPKRFPWIELLGDEEKNGPNPFCEEARRQAIAAIAALPPQGDGLAELRALSEKATPGPWSALGGVLLGPSGPQTDYDPMVIGAFKAGKGLVAGITYAVYSVPTKTEGVANTEFAAACVNHVRAEIERGGR